MAKQKEAKLLFQHVFEVYSDGKVKIFKNGIASTIPSEETSTLAWRLDEIVREVKTGAYDALCKRALEAN